MVAGAPSIYIKDLTYNFPDGSEALKNINVDLPPGSRTLLIGGMFCFSVSALGKPGLRFFFQKEEKRSGAGDR